MRSRRFAPIGLALVLAVGMALPAAAADGPKHKSCKGFGLAFAARAQGGAEEFGFRNGGEGISFNARNEVTAPWGVTYTPPGSIAAIVHDEMFLLGLCEAA